MKDKTETEKFNTAIDTLLSIPYSELQKKLAEEKEHKEKKKKPVKASSSGRASHKGR